MLNASVVSLNVAETLMTMLGSPSNVHRRPLEDVALHAVKVCVTCAVPVPAASFSSAVPVTVVLPPLGHSAVSAIVTTAAPMPGTNPKEFAVDIASIMSLTCSSVSATGPVESPHATRVQDRSATERRRENVALV